jgi:hypothetical protein
MTTHQRMGVVNYAIFGAWQCILEVLEQTVIV